MQIMKPVCKLEVAITCCDFKSIAIFGESKGSGERIDRSKGFEVVQLICMHMRSTDPDAVILVRTAHYGENCPIHVVGQTRSRRSVNLKFTIAIGGPSDLSKTRGQILPPLSLSSCSQGRKDGA